jgi:tRNA(His) 5'-end guanylyltransferase
MFLEDNMGNKLHGVRDKLGERMKLYYENIPKNKLIRRTPVIIRLDGKTFHTFTKGFEKPFDKILIKTMQETTKYLCENIQGCVLGYTQSDEISLLLIDYQRLETSAWLDYEVQKMCSVSASMATMSFNKFFEEITENLYYNTEVAITNEEEKAWYDLYSKKFHSAVFDSRVFSIPKEEVANYFYWRQLDASTNSVQMVAHANFNHNELKGKGWSELQDMLMIEKGINWNAYTVPEKRGSCVIKTKSIKEVEYNGNKKEVERTLWIVDTNIPQFKGDDRNYIEKLI